MSVIDFVWKQGDRLPLISSTLEDENGVVDLTAATVKFKMQPIAGGALKVDAVATIISAPAGTVSYAPLLIDTDTVGLFNAEWEVTFSDGKVATFPNEKHLLVRVIADL